MFSPQTRVIFLKLFCRVKGVHATIHHEYGFWEMVTFLQGELPPDLGQGVALLLSALCHRRGAVTSACGTAATAGIARPPGLPPMRSSDSEPISSDKFIGFSRAFPELPRQWLSF